MFGHRSSNSRSDAPDASAVEAGQLAGNANEIQGDTRAQDLYYELTPLGSLLREQVGSVLELNDRLFDTKTWFDPSATEREFQIMVSDYTLRWETRSVRTAPRSRVIFSAVSHRPESSARTKRTGVGGEALAADPLGDRREGVEFDSPCAAALLLQGAAQCEPGARAGHRDSGAERARQSSSERGRGR